MPEYEDEKIETTRGEKILAFAMVIFLLIGGINVLNELKGIPDRPQMDTYYEEYGKMRPILARFCPNCGNKK